MFYIHFLNHLSTNCVFTGSYFTQFGDFPLSFEQIQA